MMESSSLSPLIFDTTDILIGFGLGAKFDPWTVNVVGGLSSIESRSVSSTENPAFPGTYDTSGGVAGISIGYRFD